MAQLMACIFIFQFFLSMSVNIRWPADCAVAENCPTSPPDFAQKRVAGVHSTPSPPRKSLAASELSDLKYCLSLWLSERRCNRASLADFVIYPRIR